jgi:hypothetical protein
VFFKTWRRSDTPQTAIQTAKRFGNNLLLQKTLHSENRIGVARISGNFPTENPAPPVKYLILSRQYGPAELD